MTTPAARTAAIGHQHQRNDPWRVQLHRVDVAPFGNHSVGRRMPLCRRADRQPRPPGNTVRSRDVAANPNRLSRTRRGITFTAPLAAGFSTLNAWMPEPPCSCKLSRTSHVRLPARRLAGSMTPEIDRRFRRRPLALQLGRRTELRSHPQLRGSVGDQFRAGQINRIAIASAAERQLFHHRRNHADVRAIPSQQIQPLTGELELHHSIAQALRRRKEPRPLDQKLACLGRLRRNRRGSPIHPGLRLSRQLELERQGLRLARIGGLLMERHLVFEGPLPHPRSQPRGRGHGRLDLVRPDRRDDRRHEERRPTAGLGIVSRHLQGVLAVAGESGPRAGTSLRPSARPHPRTRRPTRRPKPAGATAGSRSATAATARWPPSRCRGCPPADGRRTGSATRRRRLRPCSSDANRTPAPRRWA